MSALRISYEWESGDGVAARELNATWARLEIWVDTECVTLVEEEASQSSRRSIYCSLYPLAEWIAFNWWFLRAHARPAGTVIPRRAFAPAGLPWLKNHNVRAAGDGFLWPNLTIVPEGGSTRLMWQRDPRTKDHQPIRYLNEGVAICDSVGVEQTLAEFVESVLARLDEHSISETPLHEEWTAITQTDRDEEEFCIATARLGLDPYTVEEDIAGLLTTIGTKLEPELLTDFLDAVDPSGTGIHNGVVWIGRASGKVRELPARPDDRLAEMAHAIEHVEPRERPWLVGWEGARRVRATLELGNAEPFEFDGLVPMAEVPTDDPGFIGLGGETSSGGSGLVAARHMSLTAQRFAQARALWHFAAPHATRKFLLTTAHTDRQKVERAFAAELLAPASGIQHFIVDQYGIIYIDEIDSVAEHFRVSANVIRHQIENQLEFEVADEFV